MTNDKPGKKAIHHSPENKKLLPILINVPNEACVAANPTPRKDKVDSIRIEKPGIYGLLIQGVKRTGDEGSRPIL